MQQMLCARVHNVAAAILLLLLLLLLLLFNTFTVFAIVVAVALR